MFPEASARDLIGERAMLKVAGVQRGGSAIGPFVIKSLPPQICTKCNWSDAMQSPCKPALAPHTEGNIVQIS